MLGSRKHSDCVTVVNLVKPVNHVILVKYVSLVNLVRLVTAKICMKVAPVLPYPGFLPLPGQQLFSFNTFYNHNEKIVLGVWYQCCPILAFCVGGPQQPAWCTWQPEWNGFWYVPGENIRIKVYHTIFNCLPLCLPTACSHVYICWYYHMLYFDHNTLMHS